MFTPYILDKHYCDQAFGKKGNQANNDDNKGRGRTGGLATKEINYSPHCFLPAFCWIYLNSNSNINVTLLFSDCNLFEIRTDESGILINGAIHKKNVIAWSNISFFKSTLLVSKTIRLHACSLILVFVYRHFLCNFKCVWICLGNQLQLQELQVNQFVLNMGFFTSPTPPLAPPTYLHAV